jgi:hypothetical protein
MRKMAWPSLVALALLPLFLGALSPAHAQAKAKAQPVNGSEVRCGRPLTIAFVDLELSPFLHGSGDPFENPPGFFVLWAKAEAKRSIGAPRGSKQMTLAQRMGWTSVPTMGAAQGLRMLRAERFEALLAPDVLVPPELLKELPALVALQPPLQQTQHYAPVGPAFWKRDPELVWSLWRGLCRASRVQSPGLPACPKA